MKGKSGFRLLSNSTEAFMARAELIRNAQSSLDLQYYIVHDGISTRMLVDELLKAADRGVRVRILLDDTTSDGLDWIIATLAAHPQIQIRVFNPLHLGRSTGVTRTMGRLLNLSLQHRRMHNKLWLADNSVAIVGGRNLGDEYFDAEPNLNFTDIDMLSVGPVAEQLGHSFDQYWNSALSKPIDEFLSSKPTHKDLQDTRTRLEESLEETRKQNHALYQQLMTYTTHPRMDIWRRELIWAWNQALWDAPSKVLSDGEPDPHLLLTTQLAPELNGRQQRADHDLGLLRAGSAGAGLPDRPRRRRGVGQPADQLTGSHGRAGGAWRLRALSQGAAGTWREAVRIAPPARRRWRQRTAYFLQQILPWLRLQPAQQGDDLRPAEILHRLVQLRPALGAVEHRSRGAGGQPGTRRLRAQSWRCKVWRRP